MNKRRNITVYFMFVLLIVQGVSGLITNFFVDIPDSVSNQYQHGGVFYHYWGLALRWILTSSSFFLYLHVIVGSLLIIGAVLLIVLSFASRNPRWIVLSILGAAFVVTAWVNGMFFVSFGQHTLNSLIMATVFVAAFFCYLAGFAVEG